MVLSIGFWVIFITFSSKYVLTTIYYLWYNDIQMNDVQNEVQTRITELQAKDWTLAAIADEVGLTVNAVEKWKAGVHSPNKATLAFLDQLLKRKRIPKKRRYHRKQDGQSITIDIAKGKKSS
jgi:ribosome-binding protein aMBF1 (putative translation factor)